MTTMPVNYDVSASLGQQSYFNCGANPLLSLGGFTPYTLEAWINLNSVAGTHAIVAKFNGGVAAEYGFWVDGGYVVSYRNVGPWSIKSQTQLQPNQWYHVATTYDGKTLSLYVDGILEASQDFTSQPGFPDLPTYIGAVLDHNQPASFFQGRIYEVRIWNVCRSEAQINDGMEEVEPDTDGLVADYGFWLMPAEDVAPNGLPLTAVGAVGNTMEVVALKLQSQAYVDCGTDPELSLGGFQCYTLEGWINLTSTAGLNVILSKFIGGVAAEYAFSIADGRVESYRNVAPWVVHSQTTLQANQWYHVATTYDGANLCVYVNGTLEATVPFTSQPAFPGVHTLIGARQRAQSYEGYFQGYIQNVRLWRVPLTAEQVAYVMGANPGVDLGLIANYDFSIPPGGDLSGRHSITLAGGAAQTTLEQSVSQTLSFANKVAVNRPDVPRLNVPTVPLLSEAHMKLMIDEYAQSLASTPPQLSASSVRDYAQHLNQVVAAAQQNAAPTHVTKVEQDGDYYRFRFYQSGVFHGQVTLYLPGIDPQTLWYMKFTFTLIFGVLNVISTVRGASESDWRYYWERITRYAPAMSALNDFIGTPTGLKLMSFLQQLYNSGLLSAIIRQSARSWWDVFVIVADVVTYFVPGYKQAKILYKLTKLIVDLAVLIQEKPSQALRPFATVWNAPETANGKTPDLSQLRALSPASA